MIYGVLGVPGQLLIDRNSIFTVFFSYGIEFFCEENSKNIYKLHKRDKKQT